MPRMILVASCVLAYCILLYGCKKSEPVDEAKAAGLATTDFPQITADIFRPMDSGIALFPEEVMGRNTWNLWSAGNQHFWKKAEQIFSAGVPLRQQARDRDLTLLPSLKK